MHYTSWGPREKTGGETRIPLLIEGGPEELGVFSEAAPEGTAAIAGQIWQLHVDPAEGVRATLPDGTSYQASGNFGRDKKIEVSLGGRTFVFVNEARTDWIVDDAEGRKVGQFSGGNNGVRRSILEFEPGVELSDAEVAGLSWMVRLVLESRLGTSSRTLLWTLLLFTVAGIIAAFTA
ncbi:hypothetical protein [Corynebacterium halotolerans]|uniref:hypothetical protein n=1 Tax=Corynebacterium halotolerans TaxID=225326 RepID=UPI003CF7848E